MDQFYQQVSDWIQQSNLQDFAAKLNPAPRNKEPKRAELWAPFLKAVLTHTEFQLLQQSHGLNFTQMFLEPSLLATTEDFYNSIQNTILQSFKENRKQELANYFLQFHILCNQWHTHGWHILLLKQPAQNCIKIAQQLNLSAWQTANILHQVGYAVIHSKQFLNIWQQYSQQQFADYKAWITFLEQYERSITIQLDNWASWLLEPSKLQSLLGQTLHQHQWLQDIQHQTQTQEKQLYHHLLTDDTQHISDLDLIKYISRAVKSLNILTAEEHFLYYQHNYHNFLSTIENEDWVCFWKAIYEFERRTKTKKIIYGERLTNANQTFAYLQPRLSHQKKEIFLVLILDNQSRVLQVQQISQGTVNESLAHPREIFYPAIQLRASATLLAHNHPSGDPRPSPADLKTTQRLCKAGALLNIRVVDHIIIGKDRFYSFVEHGNIPMNQPLKDF